MLCSVWNTETYTALVKTNTLNFSGSAANTSMVLQLSLNLYS